MAAENTKKSRKNSGNILSGIINYFKEVRQEMSKVTWPDRDDVQRLTTIVLIVTLISALALGGLSLLMQFVIIDFGLQNEWFLGILFAAFFIGAFALNNDGLRKRIDGVISQLFS